MVRPGKVKERIMTQLVGGPTPEMAMMIPAACNGCGTWTQLGKFRLCHTCHNKRYDRLEDLREIAAMHQERLPAEVLEALNKVKP